jgi:calcineurin-like phosphoesterase family protein
MQNIFLTSDLHLGHRNIAGPKTSTWKTGYRNFDSVEEMDALIIDNINQVLYIVGDFAMGGHHKIPDYRRRIVCENIHIVLGNHDEHIPKYSEFFSSISAGKLIYVNKQGIYLHHYSCRVWEGSHKGYFHAYGHSHGSLERTPWGRSMDVGIDNCYRIFKEYRPFSFDEVALLLEDRPTAFPDHHSSETNVR